MTRLFPSCSLDAPVFLARLFPGDVGGPRSEPRPAVRLPGSLPPREACSGGLLEIVQLPLHSGGGRPHVGVPPPHGRWEQRVPPYLPRAFRLIDHFDRVVLSHPSLERELRPFCFVLFVFKYAYCWFDPWCM